MRKRKHQAPTQHGRVCSGRGTTRQGVGVLEASMSEEDCFQRTLRAASLICRAIASLMKRRVVLEPVCFS